MSVTRVYDHAAVHNDDLWCRRSALEILKEGVWRCCACFSFRPYRIFCCSPICLVPTVGTGIDRLMDFVSENCVVMNFTKCCAGRR
jgi:hypothetical protein